MKTLERIGVPTGDILIVEGHRGKLELLSIGDYGKDVNLKADCLGLSRHPSQVRHTSMLPLTEKWVITVSTQYGCSMGCTFCDVPKVGPGRNATETDLIQQVLTGMKLHPEVYGTQRMNIHFARMGEPTWNPFVLTATKWFKQHIDKDFKIHPVVSTMMPQSNRNLSTFIHAWMDIKNGLLSGEAGLQLSINSTDEWERHTMFNGSACTLEQISSIMDGIIPRGRKITLNFAVAGYAIDPCVLVKYFNPEHYIVKLTPMHKTARCVETGCKTSGDYTTFHPYERHERELQAAGYDVLVFIASREEDEGRITCGNAILSGTRPFDMLEEQEVDDDEA